MGKGLEALGKLTSTQNLTMYEQNECLKIIEKELKRIEKLENYCSKAGITIDDYFKYFIEETIDNDKKLKAFEIIKEKGLSTNEIAFIKNGESWETYVETMKELYWGDEHLDKVLKTKEEFDLLKEVLS